MDGGFLAGAIVQPAIGNIYDAKTALAIHEGYTMEALQSVAEGTADTDLWATVKPTAGKITLRHGAVLPVVLIVTFGFLFFTRKKSQIEKLDTRLK